jgi:WG containing repeat
MHLANILFAFLSITAPRQHDAKPERAVENGSPCVFDFERGEVSDCVRQTSAGHLYISPTILSQLTFDSHGLATVHSQVENWMYVNRRGDVVISGVPTFDNGADTFHDGLVRFVRDGKYGFANYKGKIVVAAVYEGAMNFDGGRAKVCDGCTLKCSEPGCEHLSFVGGKWLEISTKGVVLASPPGN